MVFLLGGGDLQVIVATHSPFIVRGATLDSNIAWLVEGKVQQVDRDSVELRLGWGTLGKKILIISEDSDTTLLRSIVEQWPDLARQVSFYPRNGTKSLPDPEEAKLLVKVLGGKMKILIHRDRDALTDEETERIASQYTDQNVEVGLRITPL